MKTAGTVFVCLVSVLCALCQGTLTFNNDILGQVVAPIYGPETDDPAAAKIGNTAAGFPAGTQVYSGPLLSGSGWSAQLLGAPETGQPESALAPLSPIVSFRTGTGAGFISPVTFTPLFPAGTVATYEMVAWDNRGGAVNDWSSAQVLWSQGLLAAGKSTLYAGPTTGNTTFLRSFNVTLVPEPSFLRLLPVAAMFLLVFRARLHC